MKAQPFISVRNLDKTFSVGGESLRVLKGVSMDIPAGQFVSIMGPSGSGKSTMLYLLGGLDRPSGGDIRIAGDLISALSSDGLAAFRSRTIGFVFQAFHLIPTLTALENVGLPGIFVGVPRQQRNERAQKLLTMLGMGDRIHHRPSQLSGGQQQRVAIARALFNQPPILMCDEPTGALDSKTGQTVMKLLRALCDQQKKTVIVITHDPTVAQAADRRIVLRDGYIVDDTMVADEAGVNPHVA